jgi:ribosomal protein S18 acetylase RimI-like enzyme
VKLPPLTPELLERLEQATLGKGQATLKRAAQLPGNPHGVTLIGSNGLSGSIVVSLPKLPWYNLITGLSEDNLAELPGLLEVYTRREVQPTLILSATCLTEQVGNTLFDLGFAARRHSSTLYTVSERLETKPDAGIMVRELEHGEDTSTFNAVLTEGYGFTNPHQRSLLELENDSPDVRRYLGFVDAKPAAAAALTVHDSIAYLAGAATIPNFRGRGAQTALIRQRLTDAAACSELTVVTTAFASQSQQNLERVGFRLAQVKTSWARR